MRGEKGQVMIGTPTLDGKVWFNYMNSYVHTMVRCANVGWSVQTNGLSGCSLINYARAAIAQDFWDSDCDVLFFVDSDLGWDPAGFVRMLLDPHEFITGMYPAKQDELKFHSKGWMNGHLYLRETNRSPGGFLKLTRSVLKRMREAHPELKAHTRGRDFFMLWDPMILKGEPLGEDFSFGQRWIDIGGQIWIDPDIDFEHLGGKIFSGNLAKDQDAENAIYSQGDMKWQLAQ